MEVKNFEKKESLILHVVLIVLEIDAICFKKIDFFLFFKEKKMSDSTCQKCQSDRVLTVSAKCCDLCSCAIKDQSYDGYVPSDASIGGGKYIEISFCMDCGQMQGEFPVPLTRLEQGKEDEDEEEKN